MRLIAGETYEVMDWYGMLSFPAEYVGEIRNVNGNYLDRLLLVRRNDGREGAYGYAGCEIRTSFTARTGEVRTYLHATHYGNSLEELKHCTKRDLPPKWELVS